MIKISGYTFGTAKISEERIAEIVVKQFPLKPKQIIDAFNLKRPIYSKTACYGHFGKSELPWEALDKVEILKKESEVELVKQT